MKSEKKEGGTLEQWQLHKLSYTGDQAREWGYETKLDECYVLSGVIVEDPTGRWNPGDHFRSSLVCNMDLEEGIIETQNTVYRVVGKGGNDILPDMGDGISRIFY